MHIKRRVAVLAGTVAIAAMALAGCSTTASSSANSSSANGNKTVAFVPGFLGNGFYNMVWRGIQEQAKKYGYTATQQGSDSAFSASAQTPFVDAVCSKKPTILIIAPTDPVAMRDPIQTCMNEGVTVVLVDTTLTNTSGIVSSVSSDNEVGGKLAAEFIGKKLNGKGTVSIHSGSPEAETQAARRTGAEAEFAKAFPHISLIPTILDASTGAAQTSTTSSLIAHPTLAAVFDATGACVGEAQAIKTSGKNPLLVCYDSSPAEDTLLQNGQVGALVLQAAEQEGSTSMQYGWDFLNGRKSAIKKTVVIPPVIVTSAESKDPKYEAYFYH